MKFDRMTQIWSLKRTSRKKFEFFKIQDGGGGPFQEQLNRDIFATVWPISTKFGAVTRMGIPDRTRPKTIRTIQNPEWQHFIFYLIKPQIL